MLHRHMTGDNKNWITFPALSTSISIIRNAITGKISEE
jgi:hypothetical protein